MYNHTENHQKRLSRLRRPRGATVRGLVCLTTISALMYWSPNPAPAAPLDLMSARTALRAYHAYIAALVSGLPASEERADAFVSSIATDCPKVLSPVASAPLDSATEASLNALGQEIGIDTALAVSAPGAKPFATLSKTLSRLRWSSAQTAVAVSRFIQATHAFLGLPMSDLCQDARTLATSGAQSIPSGTFEFIEEAKGDISAAGLGTSSFDKVIGRFSTPAERRTIDATNRLLTKLASVHSALAETAGLKLLPVLGLEPEVTL